MAIVGGSIIWNLDVDKGKFDSKLSQASTQAHRLGSGFDNIASGMQAGAERTGQFINRMTKRLAIAAGGAVLFGLKTAGSLEASRQGFKTLLGSAEKADKTMQRIKEEAKRTPFEVVGLTQAAQLLTAVTKDGDKAIDIILDVGEGLAAMGRGQEELDRISVNLQQIAASGRAFGIDIKQFAFAGIPIFEMLQEETGKSGEALSEFIEEGGVTFDMLTKMFDNATKKGGRFFGVYKDQLGTFNQLWSNTKDSLALVSAEIVTQSGLFQMSKDAMGGFVKLIEDNKETIVTTIQGWITKIKEYAMTVKNVFMSGGWDAVGRKLITDITTGFVNALPAMVATATGLIITLADDIVLGFGQGIIQAAQAHPLQFATFFLLLGFTPGVVLVALRTVLAGIPIIGPIFSWILGALGGIARLVLTPVRNLFLGMAVKGVAWFRGGLAALGRLSSTIFSHISSSVGGAASKVFGRFSWMGAGAGSAFSVAMIAAVTAALVVAWSLINNAIKGANEARDAASASGAAADASERRMIESWRKSGKSEKWINKRWLALQKARGGPGRAMGGRVQPGQPYTVGEMGRELFVPDQAGKIIPNSKLKKKESSPVYNITLNLSGVMARSRVEVRAIAKDMIEAVDEELRANGKTPILRVSNV